jgi:Flp pilus assembly protein TadB
MMAPDYLRPLTENSWGHAVLAAAFGIDALAYIMSLRISNVEA